MSAPESSDRLQRVEAVWKRLNRRRQHIEHRRATWIFVFPRLLPILDRFVRHHTFGRDSGAQRGANGAYAATILIALIVAAMPSICMTRFRL
jgi:hypothetical protein